MPKRFIDTDIFDRPWFIKLSPVEKCSVFYLYLRCDRAGFWPVYLDTISHYCNNNRPVDPNILDNIKDIEIREDWLWIRDFVPFQDPNGLKANNRAHLAIISRLQHMVALFPEANEYLPDEFKVEVAISGGSKSLSDKEKRAVTERPLPEIIPVDSIGGLTRQPARLIGAAGECYGEKTSSIPASPIKQEGADASLPPEVGSCGPHQPAAAPSPHIGTPNPYASPKSVYDATATTDLDATAWHLSMFVAHKAGLNGNANVHLKCIIRWLAIWWEDEACRRHACRYFIKDVAGLTSTKCIAPIWTTTLHPKSFIAQPDRLRKAIHADIEQERLKLTSKARDAADERKAQAEAQRDIDESGWREQVNVRAAAEKAKWEAFLAEKAGGQT